MNSSALVTSVPTASIACYAAFKTPFAGRLLKAYDDAHQGVPLLSTDTREDTITTNVAGSSIFQAIRRDALGRVVFSAEPTPVTISQDFGPRTFIGSDIHDGVAQVKATRKDTNNTDWTQTRSFSRNALGFLTAETHPESGTTTYGSFTAMGWPQSTTTGDITVSKEYDALGRVKRVYSGGQDFARIYFDGNEGGVRMDSHLGKVTKRIGFNPAAFENARVEDLFTYSGRGGRLSTRQTDFFRAGSSTTPFASLGQTQTWNVFGLPATLALSGPGPSFSTETYYRAGLPTRVASGTQSLVSSASYHPHGGLRSYTTAKGVETSFASDAHGLPRPSRISTYGATTNFDTGSFTYDGAGNVTSMGPVNGNTDAFTYDRLSRLKTANWNTISPAQTESFTYDGSAERGFGNLASAFYNGQAVPYSLHASPVTNRLTSGGYDARGNLSSFPAATPTESYTYDALSRRTSDSRLGTVVSWHLYDGVDERMARVLPATSPSQGALRFYALTPCRFLDTRLSAGSFGGPFLTAGQSRAFSAPGRCGIPGSAVSLVGNVTTIPRGDSGSAVGTHTQGFIKLYPEDIVAPTASASTVFPSKVRGQIVFGKLSTAGAFRLMAELPASETVDAILDVSGYFAPASTASATRRWLLTQRDEANRGVAEWTWQEGSSSITAQSYHVFLGAMKVATREVAPATSWAFFASDHLGTPRLRTGVKAQGQSLAPTLETYRYRAFGERFIAPVQVERPGREFAMMERDSILPDGATSASGSGHHYDHARFFADRFARFLSPDQVNGTPEDPASWNRYTYARNNPLKYVDPDGRATRFFTDLAASVISAGSTVQAAGASLNGGGPIGIASDAVVGTAGSMIQGFGDMFNLGSSYGDVRGSGGGAFELTNALSIEVGRASGIVLVVAGTAQSLGVPSTTLGSTTIATADGAATVPGGYVRGIADNGQGVVYRPPGSTGNAGIVRVGGPNALNPAGYAKVYNKGGQPMNLATGKPGSNSLTHPALTGSATIKPVRVVPVPAPCNRATDGCQ